MPKINLIIPDGVEFSDLKLSLTPDGSLECDVETINRICDASGIDPSIFFESNEANLMQLILDWYKMHRANGGAPDAVIEDVRAEVDVEDATGTQAVYTDKIM